MCLIVRTYNEKSLMATDCLIFESVYPPHVVPDQVNRVKAA